MPLELLAVRGGMKAEDAEVGSEETRGGMLLTLLTIGLEELNLGLTLMSS